MSKLLNLSFFQGGGGGGVNSNFTPLSRTNTETMGGSYAGADMMATNGLSANQNQVILNDRCMITPKIRLTETISQYMLG